jgi:hypothetical protein
MYKCNILSSLTACTGALLTVSICILGISLLGKNIAPNGPQTITILSFLFLGIIMMAVGLNKKNKKENGRA